MTENERLKIIRRKLGLSQAELAERLYMKQGSISDAERGSKGIKVSNTIKFLLNKEFYVNIEWIETGKGEIFLKKESERDIDKVDKELGLEKEEDLTISRLITLLEKKDKQLENLIRMLDDQIQINKKINVRPDSATCAAASGSGIEK